MKIGEYESKEIPIMGCKKPLIGFVNKDGEYIGDVKFARLLTKKGIKAIKANKKANVCEIGFCEKEQKWYGWSHRAMYGFGIKHIVKKGSCESISGWTEEHLKSHPEDDLSVEIGFECKILDDCKKCAIAFAESVS